MEQNLLKVENQLDSFPDLVNQGESILIRGDASEVLNALDANEP